MNRDGKRAVNRKHGHSSSMRKEFDAIVLANHDLIELISKLPRDAKGARVFPERIKGAILSATDGFPIQWIGDAFDLQSCVVYRLRRPHLPTTSCSA